MAEITVDQLRAVRDKQSLFAFLETALGWDVDSKDPFTYAATQPNGLADVVQLSRIVPFSENDPFLIMLAEFETPFRRTHLREVLRSIRADMRKKAEYSGRPIEEIVFVCPTQGYDGISFAHFEEREGKSPKLRVFGWDSNQVDSTRTLRDINLTALKAPIRNLLDEYDWTEAKGDWLRAWDVELVTEKFYDEFDRIFKDAYSRISGIDGPEKNLFTQRLFNRLVFIRFLEEKGWLQFPSNGSPEKRDYLRMLWQDYLTKKTTTSNFYRDRLRMLFFAGLNTAHGIDTIGINSGGFLTDLIGKVPYLNGGLFEEDDADRDTDVNVPDEVIAPALTDLFYAFNFTIEETTPLDVEVAVDPEMLGKIFEELVTGRHESGSYYTPRPIVSFMCHEALKGYLQDACPDETIEAIVRFVEQRRSDGLCHPENVLTALQNVQVCDPACGSGAYLLGMLHELLDLRSALFAAHKLDPKNLYERKLEIIQRNLYGVDLDKFAVNIARLRLWLSLVVNDQRTPIKDGSNVALPNLDFKIESGDSLSAPDPGNTADIDMFRHDLVEDYIKEKAVYLKTHGSAKKALRNKIDKMRADISEGSHPGANVVGFDWPVEFAEVFKTKEPLTDLGGAWNFGGTLAAPSKPGGFDIILANPPYVRQESIGVTKPHLQKLYANGVDGKSDLFCYFYIRAMQLLRPGGIQVFICSNSWLDVGYGGKLQKYLLEHGHVNSIYDSEVERQFATADINTIVSIVQKGKPNDSDETRFISLRAPFDEALADSTKRREIKRRRAELWEAGLDEESIRGIRPYTGDKWGGKYLRAPDVYWTILERGKDKLTRLGNIARVQRGFTTGVNDFFYVRILGIENGIALIRCDDGSEHTIEAEYVTEPVLVKARELARPHLSIFDLQYRLVRMDASATRKPHARAYIRWGEASRTNPKGDEIGQFHLRPTTANRSPWYRPDERETADIFIPIGHKRRPVVGYSPGVLASDNLVEISLNDAATGRLVAGCVLTAFTMLLYEITGRANFGQGLLKTQTYEIADLLTINPDKVRHAPRTAFENAFDKIARREPQMIYDEVKRQDRYELDDAFLNAVGFSDPTERADVLAELHDATCRRVWARQAKAEKTREARQSYDDWVMSGLPFGTVDED